MENLLPKRKARKKVYEMLIDEADNASGVFAISLVSDPAIEESRLPSEGYRCLP